MNLQGALHRPLENCFKGLLGTGGCGQAPWCPKVALAVSLMVCLGALMACVLFTAVLTPTQVKAPAATTFFICLESASPHIKGETQWLTLDLAHTPFRHTELLWRLSLLVSCRGSLPFISLAMGGERPQVVVCGYDLREGHSRVSLRHGPEHRDKALVDPLLKDLKTTKAGKIVSKCSPGPRCPKGEV